MIKDWSGHTILEDHIENHCGTTITLTPRFKSGSVYQIIELLDKAAKNGFICGSYIDPTYPVDVELTVPAMTVGYILGDKDAIKSALPELTDGWELYK